VLTISTQAAPQAFSSVPGDHLWTFHKLGNEPKQEPSGGAAVAARRASSSPRAGQGSRMKADHGDSGNPYSPNVGMEQWFILKTQSTGFPLAAHTGSPKGRLLEPTQFCSGWFCSALGLFAPHMSRCLLALFADESCPAQAFPTAVPCQQIHSHLCLTPAEAKCWSAQPHSSPAQAPPYRAMRSFIPDCGARSHHYQLLSEQLLGTSNICRHYSPHQRHGAARSLPECLEGQCRSLSHQLGSQPQCQEQRPALCRCLLCFTGARILNPVHSALICTLTLCLMCFPKAVCLLGCLLGDNGSPGLRPRPFSPS